ncbi:MAG: hypothetical protein KDM91_01755 [Verrucomicrobiae bacterium]|nr:hypothetical protein [Verrucomicrobiae bacterium]MCP5541538.1 hypothetical protein [Akkermansiaceae bacterium]MCP5551487.1 hypothetical protein [Akkermansiaceae bacterium]
MFSSGATLAQEKKVDITENQLAQWLERFPDADTDGDGKLSLAEADAYRKKLGIGEPGKRGGAPKTFAVDPGWEGPEFPEKAVFRLSPEGIKAANGGEARAFPKPADGVLRVVGTGHSFMAPGYKTLPAICRSAGFEQPLHTHTGGGVTGSARYKWEEENGIFQFDGRPKPVLLSAIANADWEAMIWGPYYQDRPAYYECWIDFCLKYHPGMKFYLSDAWPQVEQLGEIPRNEEVLTAETVARLGREKNAQYGTLIETLNAKYPGKVFVLPTSDALVLAVERFHRGELEGVEGINRAIGKKERSIWRDQLGHLGPGFEWLEGYVFYATLYAKSPELIAEDIAPSVKQAGGFPGRALDKVFRQIAWQAVIHHPLSGVRDADGDGVGDALP